MRKVRTRGELIHHVIRSGQRENALFQHFVKISRIFLLKAVFNFPSTIPYINFDKIWKREQKVSCSSLFGGFSTLDFLDHPSWAPVANFCRKTALRAVFRQKLATGAHDGWTKKSSMRNPPNNAEHDTFCSPFQIWSLCCWLHHFLLRKTIENLFWS